MSERDGELAAREAPRAATKPVATASGQAVVRTRFTAQMVLGLLFILGLIGLLYWGREALPPFFLGLIVAYMLLPLVRRVEHTLPQGGIWLTIRRPIAAVIVFLGSLLLVAFLLRRLAQPVVEQTAQILGSLSDLWDEAQANTPGIRDWYALNVPEMARGWIDEGFQTLGQAVLSLGGNVGGWIVSFTGNALSSVVAIIALPLFVIYFLIDEPKITRQIRGQFPRAWAGDALALVHIFSRVIGSYTRGVIIESIIVGIITALGYYLIGVQVWLPLGVIAFIGEIVPIIGPWIAFFISLPVILATQPDKAVLALGLFVVIQILEGWFLAPRIQGGSVNFTPSATLLALAVGAIGGPLGVILALPAAALMRDIAFYTSYRVGGLSTTEALSQLPSFGGHETKGSSRRGALARGRIIRVSEVKESGQRPHVGLPTSGFRLPALVSVVVVQGALLVLLAQIIPGFYFSDPVAVIPAALIITLAQSVLWPIIYGIAVRFGPWLFPIVSFILTGAMITFAGWLDDQLGIGGVEVADLWTGVLVAMGLTAGHTLLAALFAIDDEQAYDRFVTAPLRRLYRDVPKMPEPGFMFLEIDGLAEPVLRDAIARGYMPTLRRWLSSGSHKLVRWDPDLSAQTSASQAGILLGSNEGIPAFRWWDKPRQELLVSSQRDTAHTLEEALSTGNGLLARDGAGRWNAFSGNAAENIGVYSVFGDAAKGSRNMLLGYLLTPYMFSRILTLYLVDVVREWWQAWQQRRKNVLPRVHRGLKYSFIRAGTTTAMQEASRHILTADLLRGVPAVYNTFFGYDEVAHHSGIDREDSLKVLATLDKIFAHLERVAREAPRPYHLFVLSDHGQSQGATFLQKYGLSLADLTHQLVATDGARDVNMTAMLQTDEAIGHVNVALSEATRGETRTASVLRRILKPRMSDGQVALGQPTTGIPTTDDPDTTDVVVLASGNLGIISFPQWKERMTLEQLDAAFPRLIPGLVVHPGISFVLVHSEERGPLAISKEGAYFLRDGSVEGEDPLASFGPHAARHLRREAEFPNVPDLLVISSVDPVTGEVPAFEELVGNHGGLGGSQREPFLLYPAVFDPGDEEIVGAGHLHDILKGWIAQEQGPD